MGRGAAFAENLDVLPTTPERSELMARVRRTGTTPELTVRALLDRSGVEFSTNAVGLPGSPDIQGKLGKRVLFVHGCFWHRHAGCRASTTPKSNRAFWAKKFADNLSRDRKKSRSLRRLDYRILVVWECELKSPKTLLRLQRRLERFFLADSPNPGAPKPGRKVAVQTAVSDSSRTPFVDAGRLVSKCEQYSLTSDGSRIERTVARRDGRFHKTSFDAARLSRLTHQNQERLAALADIAFLRQTAWPRLDSTTGVARVVDLFSGCGVMTLGVWEACRAIGTRAEPVVALDISASALRTYRTNFPDAETRCGPIEELLDGDLRSRATQVERRFVGSLGAIDLVVGGPPCQGHSDLNNHTRRDDPKNKLYERMARFAELVGPTHIIIENVSAVLHDRCQVVNRTVKLLKALGYRVDHRVIDSARLGAPQSRKRHVLAASLDRPIDLESAVMQYSRAPLTVGQTIGDLQHFTGDSAFDDAGTPTRESLRRIKYLFDKNVHELPDRLRPECHRLHAHTYKSVYGRMHWDQPAQTITSGFTCMGQGRYVHPKERRTITPHEAARLQGIPDFFRFDQAARRTALAQMIGNAVPTKLSYVIALELLR